MSFTLRDWWIAVRDRRTLAVAGVLTIGCIIAGPFGSIDLPLSVSAVYWPIVNGLALVMSIGAMGFVDGLSGMQMQRPIVRGILGSALFAVPFGVLLQIGTSVLLSTNGIIPLHILIPSVFLIAILINLLVGVFTGPAASTVPAAPLNPNRLMERLKPEMRGRLIRLGVQDHYVEVHTDKGMSLILMRLTDAIAEASDVPGERVHRSHWVARDAINDVIRREGRVFVRMSDGAEVPVSRNAQPGLRQAGLL